jgi:hypothetical protein
VGCGAVPVPARRHDLPALIEFKTEVAALTAAASAVEKLWQ